MKPLKKWFHRWLNPVQVGDVWEERNINPFEPRIRAKVVEVKDGWAKLEGLSAQTIGVMSFRSVQFYMKFISEKQQ